MPAVASIEFGAKRGTKLRENLRVTHTKILWNSCSKQWQSTCPLDFQLFHFAGQFRAAQTVYIRLHVVACRVQIYRPRPI